MTPAEIDKLFRIGVHYSCAGTDGERGSGMGLILCHELVTLNKGTLEVTSEPGKGSAFTLSLPRPVPVAL
jgi:signal transduction histidine kinase